MPDENKYKQASDDNTLLDSVSGNKQTYQEAVAQAQNPNGIDKGNTDDQGNVVLDKATASDAQMTTGSGIGAASGTQYSWDKKGSDMAQNQYQQNVLTAKQEALTQRETLESNAVNYQAQADMMQYQNNQEAEKVGWTGGYVLDQNRQQEYLKASIQAQMYGAMELQKYGYDSALAAARLSFDANQKEYAQKYYETAVSQALSEAQMTGTYFSAETKDMMGQYAVAEDTLKNLPRDKEGNIDKESDAYTKLSAEEKASVDRAIGVQNNINDWFKLNGISQAGVKTLEAWNAEQNLELQWSNELYNRYQAALDSAKDDLSTDVNSFIMLDDNGNTSYDGTQVQTGSWKTMSGEDILNYLSNDSSGQKQQQFFSYIDNQLTNKTTAGFAQWCKANEITSDYKDYMLEYLSENDTLIKFLQSKFSNVDESQAENLFEQLNGYTIDMDLPDGTTYQYTLTVSTDSSGTLSSNGQSVDKNTGMTQPDANGNSYLYLKPQSSGYDVIKALNTSKWKELTDSLAKQEYSGDPLESLENVLANISTVTVGVVGAASGIAAATASSLSALSMISTGLSASGIGIPAAIVTEGVAELVKWISDGVQAGSYKEAKATYEQLSKIYTDAIGKENLQLMIADYKKYEDMSEYDKGSLNAQQRNNYEEMGTFIKNYMYIQEAINYCDKRDSNIITSGWDYVGDSWSKTAESWGKTNSLVDVFTNVGKTIGSTVDTVIGGVTGFFRWAFGGGIK